jgi:VPDSG-CTERM motif
MSNSTLNMKNETPLVTVPSRSSLRLASVLVIAALMAVSPTLMRANTIAENIGGPDTSGSGFYWGQSFTTVMIGPESNIAFNLFSDVPATTPYALGTGFLLSMAYTGTPSSLSSSTPGFLGQANASGGFWTFNSSLTLLPNTQYFFYENAALGSISGNNAYAGGQFYFSFSDMGNFLFGGGNSINFRVTGSPAGVPDGGSTLSLLGLASLGLVALRRKLRG